MASVSPVCVLLVINTAEPVKLIITQIQTFGQSRSEKCMFRLEKHPLSNPQTLIIHIIPREFNINS